MAGPKLLDKRIVNAELATQRKNQIDAGLTMTKKIDVVRDTLQTEEQRLEQFRSESIRKVQQEIDSKIAERDMLERSNAILREDRIRLSAPIDLSEAWAEVKTQKQENAEWKGRLTEQSIELLAREGANKDVGEELAKRVLNTSKKDELTERTLLEAETKFTEASDTLEKAQFESKKLLDSAKEEVKEVKIREDMVETREKYVFEKEQEVNAHEIDLSNREMKLRSRQEIFLKAQNYLKKKNK